MLPSKPKAWTDLVRATHETLHGHATPPEVHQGRRRLLATFAVAPSRGLHARLWMPGATALALLGLLLWFGRTLWPTPPRLDYALEGAAKREGGYVLAGAQGSVITFSDGSRIKLDPYAQVRVYDLRPAGASVAVEEGRLKLQIVHRQASLWRVEAGPFRVHVTGTAFDVIWSGRQQQIEVRLHEGQVVVEGPPLAEGKVLMPGQTFVASALEQKQSANTSNSVAFVPPTEPPGDLHVAPRAPNPVRSPGVPPARDDAGPSAWHTLVAAGRYAEVVHAARTLGIERCLRHCGASDLNALAEAARYGLEADLALSALHAQRRRFPRSSEARSAAFLIARVAEARDGDLKAALRWYDLYLKESPKGPLAAEALGRKMVLLNQRGDPDAKAIAKRYLEEHPHGFHTQIARELIKGSDL